MSGSRILFCALTVLISGCGVFETPHRFNPYDPKGESNYYFPYLTNGVALRNHVFLSPVSPGNPFVYRGQKISLALPAVWEGRTLSKFRFNIDADESWETNWSANRFFSHSFSTGGNHRIFGEAIYQNAFVYRFTNQSLRVVGGGSGNLSFSQDLSPGVSAPSLALGDIDGDGDPDLVMTGFDGSSRNLRTYLNNGSGSFTLAQVLTPNLGSSSIALGDLDGDGDLDLVVTGDNGSTKFFLSLFNDGSGAFSQVQSFTPGLTSSGIALGDLDGDGDLDLVVTGDDGTAKQSKVFKNNGSGIFSLFQTLSPGVFTSSIALGDLDGDNDLDLVLTGDDGGANHFKIFTNNGSGSFTLLQSLATGLNTSSIALGDLDKDGDLDLVVTGYDGAASHFESYKNNGSGTFTLSQTITSGVSISSVVLGDLDNDGDLDIAMTGSQPPPQFSTYRNNGSGVFTLGQNLSPTVNGSCLVLGDLDGDTDLDLVMTGINGGTRYFKIYLNQ
ncbi:MAG: VCBS repeat-containing protein [Spirochaetia bacterium]|nr:VCBS repeat-containing protein [Spirochaetia bacterium]